MTRLIGVLIEIIGLALIALSAILFAAAQPDASLSFFIVGIVIAIIGYVILTTFDQQEEKPTR